MDNFGKAKVVCCHPRLCVANSLVIFGMIAPDVNCRQGIVVIDSRMGLVFSKGWDDRGYRHWPLNVLPQVPSAETVESFGLPLSIVVIGAIVGELRELRLKCRFVFFVGHFAFRGFTEVLRVLSGVLITIRAHNLSGTGRIWHERVRN